jgi:hypothetical protein
MDSEDNKVDLQQEVYLYYRRRGYGSAMRKHSKSLCSLDPEHSTYYQVDFPLKHRTTLVRRTAV